MKTLNFLKSLDPESHIEVNGHRLFVSKIAFNRFYLSKLCFFCSDFYAITPISDNPGFCIYIHDNDENS